VVGFGVGAGGAVQQRKYAEHGKGSAHSDMVAPMRRDRSSKKINSITVGKVEIIVYLADKISKQC
jgi:hypothetical protein